MILDLCYELTICRIKWHKLDNEKLLSYWKWEPYKDAAQSRNVVNGVCSQTTYVHVKSAANSSLSFKSSKGQLLTELDP